MVTDQFFLLNLILLSVTQKMRADHDLVMVNIFTYVLLNSVLILPNGMSSYRPINNIKKQFLFISSTQLRIEPDHVNISAYLK